MKPLPAKSALVVLLLTALVLAGCGGGGKAKINAKPWNLSITKNTPSAIEVDVIGVTDIEKPAWEGYSINNYWMPGDQRRTDADKLTMDLPTGKEWVIDRENPQWKKWLDRGVTWVLIIARLPGRFEGGASDPRRIFASLDKKAWKEKTIKFEVRDSEIRSLTPQR